MTGVITDQPTGERGEVWQPVLVDTDQPLPDLPTGGATHLWVVALTRGRPVGHVLVPAPLDPFPAVLLADALARHLGKALFAEHLRASVVVERPTGELPTASVLVCTRDRPQDLERCLAAIARLDHPVEEVIVVDNGSRGPATREVVEAAGARWVPEPLPGLDRARNRGVAEARSEVLLCTDDDAEVHPGWATALLRLFADPLVMAATGLVLPARLDTPARLAFERKVSFGRGYRRRTFEGSRVPPAFAAQAGAGASMAVRVGYVRAVGGFPEELDAGMPTESGGDTYLIYRALRDGYRVVYEPGALAWHTHRESDEALERVLRGYGVGMYSFLARTLIEGDLATFIRGGVGSGKWTARLVAGSVLGRPAALPRAAALATVAGSFAAPKRFLAARRLVGARAPALSPPADPSHAGPSGLPTPVPAPAVVPTASAPAAPAVAPAPAVGPALGEPESTWPEDLPSTSVVIPTRGRRDSVLALLAALDRQRYPADRLEVVVAVDGDLDGTAQAVERSELRLTVRVVVLDPPAGRPKEGNGAGEARNRAAAVARGDLLVFLDDDVLPTHDGVLLAHAAAHVAAQVDGPAAVVGPCPPRQLHVQGTWPQQVRNWWVDQTGRLDHDRDHGLAFTDVMTGNLSLPRATFLELGGFEALPRREDWELGYRLVTAGVPLRGAPEASVLHDADLRLDEGLEDRRREAGGDVAFARRHPQALARLPLSGWEDQGPRGRAIVTRVLDRPEAARRLGLVLRRAVPVLDRVGARKSAVALIDRLQALFYWSGVGEGAGGVQGWLDVRQEARAAHERTPVMDLADAAMPDLQAAAELQVDHHGLPLGRAPVRWGLLPFDDTVFGQRVVDEFGDLALRATVRNGGSTGAIRR